MESRFLKFVAASAVFMSVLLLLDGDGLQRQLALGIATALFLWYFARSSEVRTSQIVCCIIVATVGEVVLSLGWGLYSYRHAVIPLYVPPGHGLFYTLAATTARQPAVLLRASSITRWTLISGTIIAIVSLTLRHDVWGFLWWIGAVALIFVSKNRLLLSACFVYTIILEWVGTAIGNWTWAAEVPFLRLHSDKVLTAAGLGLIGGVLLVMIGVGICARAGMLREQMTKQAQMNRSPRRGILMGVVSGIGAAAMNFGVAFGSPVVEAAAAHGANPAWRMNAVWLPLMAAGAIPNLFYCAYLMRSKRTSANFSVNGTGRYWLFASVMAVFWFASTLMYGVASLKLGVLGPVYGWPFFMSLIVIVSSVIGILAGEWKHATRSAVGLQFAGVAVLITSVIMLSYTGRHL